ncbi:WXG100 family type VII secretion target [Nocardia sp. SYP-A9097]|uniref:WXG100 family type VII secretion target n=1 Tax=Nocardia sp. SYP-A9097 TaxID=2663237 RepID=UPI00129B477E|nr:WXG100 family type VII secretion target [Nocardia sp. SYP-A9097]MRH92834.1 WXG100 family type VII secretion target [Nocardia sp. SYP-A9097]
MSGDPDGYSTDLTEMQQLIDRATQIETTIEQRLGDIEQRVGALHVQWSGIAASAHSSAHTRWVQAARELHQALTDLRGGTDQARTIYSGVVTTNQKMWPA